MSARGQRRQGERVKEGKGERGVEEKSVGIQRSILHVGRRISPSGRSRHVYRGNKDLPWSVQMGYRFTIGLTPSKTRLTRGSTRIRHFRPDPTAPTETQETSSLQFVQDGECASERLSRGSRAARVESSQSSRERRRGALLPPPLALRARARSLSLFLALARDQYNYVTLTKENRSHTDVPLVGGFSPTTAIAASVSIFSRDSRLGSFSSTFPPRAMSRIHDTVYTLARLFNLSAKKIV